MLDIKLLEKDQLVINNLRGLAQALQIAAESRFISYEHGKSIFKKYLDFSGMNIPKEEIPKKG